MIAWILFGIVVVVLVLLVWYIKVLMKRVTQLAVGIGRLKVIVTKYAMYLEHLHSLDVFNGEPIIQDMIVRTRSVSKEIQDNYDLFDIIEGKDIEETT